MKNIKMRLCELLLLLMYLILIPTTYSRYILPLRKEHAVLREQISNRNGINDKVVLFRSEAEMLFTLIEKEQIRSLDITQAFWIFGGSVFIYLFIIRGLIDKNYKYYSRQRLDEEPPSNLNK